MATLTVYTAKADPSNSTNPGTTRTTPVTTGITYDDAAAGRIFPTIGAFLTFLQRNDHDGLTWSASSDGGTTFVQRDDSLGAY